jgi:hypothetical protein
MSPEQERQILESMLEALDAQEHGTRKPWQRLASTALWLAVTAMFFIVFRYTDSLSWPHYVLAGGCFALGLAFSYGLYKAIYADQWPVMAQYIRREQVELRLEELRDGGANRALTSVYGLLP